VAVDIEPYEGGELSATEYTSTTTASATSPASAVAAATAAPGAARPRWWLTLALANVLPKVRHFEFVCACSSAVSLTT
jgi:hypothetical protein